MEFEMIICIVNSGFSDDVMEAAREVGARGGTVINGRGTTSQAIEKVLNIAIHPEKEIVLLVIDKTIKEAVLHSLYNKVGLNTAGQGIAISIPVDDVVGISQNI